MNEKIKSSLGESYSWDSELGELNYRGNPLSHHNMTDSEKLAASECKAELHKCGTYDPWRDFAVEMAISEMERFNRSQQTPNPAPNCPQCYGKSVYVRTREFETEFSNVWTCQRQLCKHFNLYFHTDHKKPTT